MFEFRNVKLYQGDCTDSTLFTEPFIDLIVTSPPYNVGIEYNSNEDTLHYDEYLSFSYKWIKNCYDWTKTTGRFCLNIPFDTHIYGPQTISADLIHIAKKAGWKYKSNIIWDKGYFVGGTAWGSYKSASAPMFLSPTEMILVFYKDEWKKAEKGEDDITGEEFTSWSNSLWKIKPESATKIGHPAPFPTDIPYRCIKYFSFIGSTVFDPFSGSGTTLIEAERLNRKGVGIELDDKYFKLACNRIQGESSTLF